MAIQFIAPAKTDMHSSSWSNDFRIFMAGTIEMGKSRDWQKEFADSIMEEFPGHEVLLYNPRRTDWDPSWVQSVNNKNFVEQVEWELTNLEKANLIIFNFEPNTISPVTLAEFGLFAKEKRTKVLVHCAPGYARKGNVDIMCRRYNVQQVNSFEKLIGETKNIIARWQSIK